MNVNDPHSFEATRACVQCVKGCEERADVIHGKVAIVTGAAQGRRAIAESLAQAGG